jgi:hypothetical protein
MVKGHANAAVGLVALALSACGIAHDLPEGSGGASAGGGGMAGGNQGAGAGGAGALTCTVVDADGDGVTDRTGGGCILFNDSTRPTTDDCDDADASIALAAFTDADGDGAGDPLRPVCLPPGQLPPGYALTGTDCNDTSAIIHPSMLEVAGDGLDQNCDGSDGFVTCGNLLSCACDDGGAVSVETPCGGFDLAVTEFEACSRGGCGQTQIYIAKVANLGTEDAPGEISVFGDDTEIVRLVGLAAGRVTPPILWNGPVPASIRVSVTRANLDETEPGDCNPENDAFEVSSGGLNPLCK